MQREFVNSLVEELKVQNGTEFEFFCEPILEIILGQPIIAKGHNLYAKPVGYTVDFQASEFSAVAGQCSTELNYFENLKKPIDDILASIKNNPKCKKIFLFSNSRYTGGELASLENQIVSNQQLTGYEIVIYDSERIAKFIFNNISNKRIQDALKKAPISEKIYKVLPNTNNIPGYKNKYYSRIEEEEIKKKLELYDIVQVYGLSGMGKSEVAKKIGKEYLNGSNIDTVIWIQADEQNVRGLNWTSVKIDEFNNTINAEYFLSKYKVLIILDNIDYNIGQVISEFHRINTKGSKLVITSIERLIKQEQCVKIDLLPETIAKSIFSDCSIEPNEFQMNIIIEKIKGYPLMLNILRQLVEIGDFTWNELVEEANSIHKISDYDRDSTIKLCNRIIGKYVDGFKEELAALKYINSTKIHHDLLHCILKKIGVNNLVKKAIITQNEKARYYNIHNVILESIKEIITDNQYIDYFSKSTYTYFSKATLIGDIDYFKLIFTHRKFIEALYMDSNIDKQFKKVLLCSLIYSRDQLMKKNEIISEIDKLNIDEVNTVDVYDILLIIEKYEIELLAINDDIDEFGEIYYINKVYEFISILEHFLDNDKLQEKTKLLLKHHIGKAYTKLHTKLKKNNAEKHEVDATYNKALNYLNYVLINNPEYYETRLQLARIYAENDKIEEAIEHIRYVLNKRKDDNISLTIIFAFYELITRYKFEKLKEEYYTSDLGYFINLLMDSLHKDFAYPYIVISKYTRDLSFNYPKVFYLLMEKLPFPAIIEFNDKVACAYAEINLQYYKAIKYNNIEFDDYQYKLNKLNESFIISEKYFGAVKKKDDFVRKQFMDLYIEASQFKNAKKIADEYINKDDVFYLQNLCKIRDGLGETNLALEAIDKAIVNADSQKNIKGVHKAAFYYNKSCIQKK